MAPKLLWIHYSLCKIDSADVSTPRGWGDDPGDLGQPICSQRVRFEDALLLAFQMEGGAMSQGLQTASRSWKGQGNRFSP